MIASASFDGTTSLWVNSGGEFECVSTLEGHENEVKSVAWSQDGKHLATCSRDKNIWIWETNDSFEYECLSVLSGHTQDVKMVKWNSRLNMLFSCSYDDTVKAWGYDEALDDWVCSYTLEGHGSTVWGLDFDADEQHLVSVGDDRRLVLWEVGPTNYHHKGVLEGLHSRCIYSCSWSKTSGLIATGGGDNCVRLVDASDIASPKAYGEQVGSHSNDVNCVAFHPSSDIVAS